MGKVVKKEYQGNKILCEYTSSNLTKGVYDTDTQLLEITFKSGMTYKYKDVPHNIFAALNLSESHGKFFNMHISRSFEYEKVL